LTDQYGLLMRELKKCTPADHPSYGNVCTANELVGNALEVTFGWAMTLM
jgi:hypothetical protein